MRRISFLLRLSAILAVHGAFGDSPRRTPDVYVVSDICHIDPAIRHFAADFLKQTRQTNEKIDCVFVEWDPGANTAIRDYLDKTRTFDDAINGERARMRRLSGRGNMPMLDQYLLDTAREEKVGNGHVNVYAVNSIHGSKVRTEATEADDRFSDYAPSGDKDPYDFAPKEVIENMIAKDIVARNGVIAENIDEHFLNGDCHAGILIVGSDHVAETDHGYPSVPTVPGFLQMKNRSVQVVDPNIHNLCQPH